VLDAGVALDAGLVRGHVRALVRGRGGVAGGSGRGVIDPGGARDAVLAAGEVAGRLVRR
jgi:hypothetical protein